MSVMATRQSSSNGKPKSPRIQVVIPEGLCARLTFLAENESRTVSNMAKVLIQEGVERLESKDLDRREGNYQMPNTKSLKTSLELEQTRRLRGAPRRIRLKRQ